MIGQDCRVKRKSAAMPPSTGGTVATLAVVVSMAHLTVAKIIGIFSVQALVRRLAGPLPLRHGGACPHAYQD
jgi:hypothetical protein